MSTSSTFDLAAAFTEIYGHEPIGIWSGPGRVNLIGEHTDYNDGFVLPFAISRRARVAVGVRTDRVLQAASTFAPGEVVTTTLDEVGPGAVTGWASYVLGMAWALGQKSATGAGADLSGATGLELLVDSDVPVGAGLSSSAALECAAGTAMNDLWGLGRTGEQLAGAGQVCENKVAGAPTGILDQSASVLSAAGHVLLLDCRDLSHELVPFDVVSVGLEVLVIDTRVEHTHAGGEYASRREACEAGAAALGVPALRDVTPADLPRARDILDDVTFRRVRHVVTEDQRVLETVAALRAHGPRAIGDLLTASHVSLRDDFEVSCPELDVAVEAALAHGALGARMTGGGFGGCAIALIEAGTAPEVAAAVTEAFAAHGFARAPQWFTVIPQAGAGRETDERN